MRTETTKVLAEKADSKWVLMDAENTGDKARPWNQLSAT